MSLDAVTLGDRVEALVANEDIAGALALLHEAVERSDPHGLFVLAAWMLSGRRVPRDLPRARDLFRRAAEAGHNDAGAVHTAFLANGTGGVADWKGALEWLGHRSRTCPAARRQRDLIAAMALTSEGEPAQLPESTMLSRAPHIRAVRGLFSVAECAYLIEAAGPMFEPSLVVDPRSGRLISDPVRTADVAAFPLAIENPAIHALNRRLAAATGTGVTQGEPLQILRYGAGQQYKPHLDTLADDDNQRIITALIYLNDGYAGGETWFPSTGKAMRGAPGDALIFRNVIASGEPDPASRHAGMPVGSGTKYLASRWIRAAPLKLTP